MRYRLLGKTGLRVSEICLGTMTFGKEWGWGADREESRKIFDTFIEAGGNFLDTANRYTEGTSEKLVGEFAKSERDRFVIATKYTMSERPDDPNGGGNQRKTMVQALEGSLKRLGMDYVDLFWVHSWDFMTPIDEVLRGLDDLVRAGKVLYAGISNTPAWVVARANTIAELRGWTRFSAIQVQYSLLKREAERELLQMADALDVAVTAWEPLGSGVLTGKYKREGDPPEDARLKKGPWADAYLTDKNFAIAEAVQAVAKEVDRPPAQVALNWLRQSSLGVVIPIVGVRTAKQLKDNLGCVDFELTLDQLEMLDKVSAIDLGYPNQILKGPMVKGMIHGKTADRIHLHKTRD